ncbi:FAD binding domain-containing protein [Pseudodesulfovibrio sp. zrk46]|uniref:FAD binding domain-containing protein n=1 Tax=Pseudodesulfovibrio sp. zrk46 TaxID=2725288 RepID=UPI0014494CC7|nr:FAD binding domain-containing protein [Pseudodesulfovibrio sp. zrk46]QJB57034.1 hypothetical protein HFN16_11765 [Pseudodesulfovibrio sp. zrk46]
MVTTFNPHPTTVREACRARLEGGVPYAGGTDFMVRHAKAVQTGQCPPLIFLEGVREFSGISVLESGLRIGALTTMAELSVDTAIPRLLATACNCVGSPALRNVATIGGNVCTASPAGDSLPALYVLGAKVEICSPEGSRTVPISEFVLGPGRTVLESDELVSAIILPDSGINMFYHRKVSPRVANAITKVSLAVGASVEDQKVEEIRIAYGSVGPTIIRCPEIEAACAGLLLSDLEAAVPALSSMVETAIAPIDDHRSSALYRRSIAANLLAECLETFASSYQRITHD